MKRLLFLLALMPMLASAQTIEPATASQVLEFGPLVDSVDATAETGLAPIADAEFTVCQDGGSCAAKSDTTDATHLGDGVYAVTYNATDSTADDHICVFTNITGTLPRKECYAVESVGFKDLRNGTDTLMTSRQAGNMNETTVATAPTTTTITLTAGASNNDAYNFGTIEFVGGTEECVKTITDYVGAGKTVTYDSACGFTVAPADVVRIHVGAAGKAVDDVDALVAALNDVSTVDLATAADTAIVDAGLDKLVVLQGTADSGNQTSFVDAALTEADANYWAKNIAVVFTDGSILGQTFCISSFTPGSDTVNFTPAATQAVSTNTYILIPAPGCDPFR